MMPARAASPIGRPLLDRLAGESAAGQRRRNVVPVHAPFSGNVFGQVPQSTADDVRAAVQRARAAQAAWAQRSFRERARVILRFHDLLLDRQPEVLDIMQLEAGKARQHALEEVVDTAIVARYYAFHEIGRASCRERGEISVVAGSLKK